MPNYSPEQLTELRLLVIQWRQIAAKCNAVAERHKTKGEKVQMIEQAAFAYGRNSCAQMLENVIGNVPEDQAGGD